MRTTVRLPDELMERAKRFAAERGITLTELIADSLRLAMAGARKRARKRERIVLPTYGGGGLMPGVDLDNSASLYELLDGDDPNKWR